MRIPLNYLAPMVLLAGACSNGPSNYSGRYEAALDSTIATADSTTLSDDVTSINSPSRKLVKTADVRCRVNSVFEAISILEHNVRSLDGLIVESTMQNEGVSVNDMYYSADSLKRIQMYTPAANLTLRIPAASLDSAVYTLTSLSTFIDYRTLKQQDKTLAYLSNSMKNKAPEPAAIKASQKGTTLDIAIYQDAKQETNTDRRIENLSILDDVRYATFTVQLFEPNKADIQIIANPERIGRPGFGSRVMSAIGNGAEIFGDFFIVLVACWPFILLLCFALIIYKRVSHKQLKALS